MQQDQDIQTVRVPFVGNPNNRDTVTSKDQRFINAYFDQYIDSEGSKHYYLVKRPGASRLIQPSGGAGTGRGTYVWKGNRYSVVDTKLYKNTTDLGVTLSTSTGICGFAETRPAAGTQYLCINDGTKLYAIATGGAVTTVTANFPNPNTTDLIYFDTYFFTFDVNGKIYQSNTDDPTTWDSSRVITAQMFNGTGVGLAQQNNMLLAFSDRHMQAFYDAANTSGSVLTNIEQVVQQLGCASQNSLVSSETLVIWITNTNTGGYTIMKMAGASGPEKCSTPGIDRILRAEGTNIATANAKWARIAGHTFYILKLTGANRTFVYDTDTEFWLEWQVAGGTGALPLVSNAQYNNTLIAQHATDGYLYTIDEGTYQDNSVNFTVFGRFRRLDLDDQKRKFTRRASLIGDIQATTTNVSLQYSDDDFVTLSTARTLDMSQANPYATTLGNFKRRSWQISYAGTNPLRLEALELKLRLGTS